MLPGYGKVVANASGTGVQDTLGYCGHGGGGGLTARAARCCWISLAIVGLKIGCARALPAHMSEVAMAATAPAPTTRRCLDKLSPAFPDSGARWMAGREAG